MSIITALEGNALASAISVGRSFLDEAVGYQWGLYDRQAYKNVFPLAKVTGVRLNASANAAQAPLEDGSFLTYNKTRNPEQWELTAVFMRDTLGTAGNQSKVLKKLADLRESTDLLFLRMPGYKSASVTLVGYGFDRTSRSGCDLLIVRATLQEVRNYAKKNVITKSGKPASPEYTGSVVAKKIGS